MFFLKNKLNVEPGFKNEIIDKIKKINYNNTIIKFSDKNMFFGGVHTVTENQQGTFEGARDKSRSGVSI